MENLETKHSVAFKNVHPLNTIAERSLRRAEAKALKNPHRSVSARLNQEAAELDRLSKYQCNFDYGIYADLEKRFEKEPPRGGILFNGGFKLVNHHYSCQECLYAFMVDTYGRGCVHDCLYCYAKSELVVHGYWNKPFPMPININAVRELFYTVFETDKRSKWRSIMQKRIPLRIGYASDSFMLLDQKYKLTQELLRILKFYQYPYIIATRSDLVADDRYLHLMDQNLCSVQMSIISTNEEINRKLERGAPSASRRLSALKRLSEAGFWTTVRINPLFPIHPDGYYTNPDFEPEKRDWKLSIFDWSMIDQLKEYSVPSVIAGFGRFSPYAINQMDNALGTDLRQFFNGKKFQGSRDYHYSDEEIRHYYERIKKLCQKNGMEFSTCYIGNGEAFFWKDQDLWDNKQDCCNAKNRVSAFQSDAQDIPFCDRAKFCNSKIKDPTPQRNLVELSRYINSKDENPFLSKEPLND